MKLSNEPGTDVSSVQLLRLGFFKGSAYSRSNGISFFNPGFLWLFCGTLLPIHCGIRLIYKGNMIIKILNFKSF